MFSIFNVVERVSHRYLKGKNEEYVKGFLACLDLFLIGIKQSTQYNASLYCRDLQRTSKDQLEELRALKEKISKLEGTMNSKALVSNIPTKKYNTFNIDTIFGEISIVINMDRHTFYACLMNFTLRYGYANKEEAKSKLLQYINSKNFEGFRAFKDEKAYSRYVGGMGARPYKKRD